MFQSIVRTTKLFVLIIIAFPHAISAYALDGLGEGGKAFKHKLAIGRFTNETVYGKSLLRDSDLDPLGKQAADILTAKLASTGRFLVFERPDLAKIQREQANVGGDIIGVDTLILGSVVEFGRATDGKRGLFNKKKVQRAHAKVSIRLVDVRTGHVFHSATGSGEVTNESGTVLGMGSTARYDATLSDQAISAAIENLTEELLNTLAGRAWRTDVLQAQDSTVFISGGARQGLGQGDRLYVMRKGETIKSQQSGFDITLPPTEVAVLEVVSTFGDSETNEGSVTRVISGQVDMAERSSLFVTDRR